MRNGDPFAMRAAHNGFGDGVLRLLLDSRNQTQDPLPVKTVGNDQIGQ